MPHDFPTSSKTTIIIPISKPGKVVTEPGRLQTTQPTRDGAVTAVWQTLCKLCRPLPSPAMGARLPFLGESRPCGPAGWLAMLLIKAGDVEINPGPTTTRKQVWICDICHRQIQVMKQDIDKVQQDWTLGAPKVRRNQPSTIYRYLDLPSTQRIQTRNTHRHNTTPPSQTLATIGNNKIMRTPPPHISSSEERLPRLTRSPVPNSEQTNLPSSNHTYTKLTPNRIHHHYVPYATPTHTTHTISSSTAPHIRTTLSPLDLWTDTAGVMELVARWRDKTGWWTKSGMIGLPPQTRVKEVGRHNNNKAW